MTSKVSKFGNFSLLVQLKNVFVGYQRVQNLECYVFQAVKILVFLIKHYSSTYFTVGFLFGRTPPPLLCCFRHSFAFDRAVTPHPAALLSTQLLDTTRSGEGPEPAAVAPLSPSPQKEKKINICHCNKNQKTILIRYVLLFFS